MIKAKLQTPLEKIVGKQNVFSRHEDRLVYSYDAKVKGQLPLLVVRPDSTRQVAAILALCNENLVPVITRGAGTGAVGGAVPINDGIVLETARMNRILEIASDEHLARVQCGVVTADLSKATKQYALFYGPDPASADTCTIGGNAATCAGGLRAVKYGVTKNHILGLTVVTASGRVIRTGVRTKKGVVGYDLTSLYVGSEGTLGVITELTVRLLPLPKEKKTLIASFDNLNSAGKCIVKILGCPVIPTVLEIMDRFTLKVVGVEKIDPALADSELLLIEIDGEGKRLKEDTDFLANLCRQNGAKRVQIAKSEAQAQSLWEARKGISPALYKIRPQKIAEDVAVPIPKIPALLEGFKKIAESHALLWAAYGHGGDGNIHANLLMDPTDADEIARAKHARSELFQLAVSLGGTISGEHGVGYAKKEFIRLELSDDSIAVQLAIKKALDPNNILNPGKIFP